MPMPLTSHSLSHRQPGPMRQPRRRATVKTETRRPRASRPGRGRDAVRRSDPGPTPPHATWHLCCRTPPLCCPPPPLKRSHRPIFFSLARRSSRPSTPERRTCFPHHPGVRLTDFLPPEPLLHVELCPSVATIRPLPVSSLRAAPFLNRPPPPHLASLPRAAGPLHARR
jgi:hypothetical protein